MSTKQIDILNIGLILLSGVLAYLFPLELFILAFAILGPLHYLTEINWLDTKQYFTKSNRLIWLSIGIVATTIIVGPKLYFEAFGRTDSQVSKVIEFLDAWSNGAIFISFILSIGFLFAKKKLVWLILIIVGIVGAVLFNGLEIYGLSVGLLIPTVIHVYLFTLLFMLYGTKKSKSKWGYLSIALAVLVPVVIIFIQIDNQAYLFADSLKDNYIESGFYVLPVRLGEMIGASNGTTFFFYEDLELRLMMFLSFIYMYHYLNWFSKTTKIEWHKNLTFKRSLVILLLWIGMLLLFYIDFSLGFIVALFFSFLHVILEFPLNMASIKALFTKS